jgi:hypothetical protein
VDRASRKPNLALRRVRELERHESRTEFSDALAQTAARMGVSITPSERYVARLEDGETINPHPAYRRVLAELCGRLITELGFPEPGSAKLHADERERGTIGAVVLGSGLTMTGREKIESLRRSITASIGGSMIAGAEVADWEQMVLNHGRATKYKSPIDLLADVTADLSELDHVLTRGGSASVMRSLTRVAAQLSGLVCLLLVKLGERNEFRN